MTLPDNKSNADKKEEKTNSKKCSTQNTRLIYGGTNKTGKSARLTKGMMVHVSRQCNKNQKGPIRRTL